MSVMFVSQLGNCDIDFLNFRHCHVWKISTLYKQNWDFGVIFRKHWKQNQKYFKTSQKPSVIPLKFHEMSLFLWNLIDVCKNFQFLVKFCKNPNDLRKILLKWLGKTVKYCLNFVNFCSCTEKWPEVDQLLSITLMKVYGIHKNFLGHKYLVLAKFHLLSSLLWLKSFASWKY